MSTTTALARALVQAVGKADKQNSELNSMVRLNASGVSDILADNRAQLVAQNMLAEGNSNEEAERAIGDLLDLLGAAESASIDLGVGDGTLRATLEIDYVAE